VGGTVGSVAHGLFPAHTASPGAYALVGMGTAFAGIVRTPLTSVIMIFEMTRDYSIIVPLMISNLISYYVSYRLQRQPIYEALAHQEGVFLPDSETREHFTRMVVEDVIEEARQLDADAPVTAAAAALDHSGHKALPVLSDGKLLGLIKASQCGHAPAWATLRQVIGPSYPFVHPDHPLSLAVERMGAHQIYVLPVVSRADRSKLLGVVTLSSILKTYGLSIALPDSSEAL